MYDIFFITYDEPNADENWSNLKSRLPHARRVHGIKGISNAHKSCARAAFTEMFYTIDGDTVVDEDFDFSFVPPPWDRGYLHLWYSRNPVNDLVYGYGALKLWPRKPLLVFDGNWLDFTTTVGNLKIIDRVVATTWFNQNPYSAWKSAFRESIKLCFNVTNGDTGESLDRLMVWLNEVNDVPFADHCRIGAREGLSYFLENSNDQEALRLINDFDWLKDMHSRSNPTDAIKLYRTDVSRMLPCKL